VTATAAGSVSHALGAATDALRAAGVPNARFDAEVLLAEATRGERADMVAQPDVGVDPGAERRFGEMVRRRLRREPVAYIVGRKGFRGIEVAVDRRVLIPRPETELLVEIALELRPETVLDVGTGSGAVALAIAAELPETRITATDTSAGALELAAENAERLGLAGRVRFEQDSVPGGDFELTVANLPYVAEGDWDGLPPEIRLFEPREALLAGPHGLDAIRGLLDAPPHCESIALEVGEGQAEDVASMARTAGFGSIEIRRDLAGIDRVVLARR
jgi:release factor glutamine methyltransferase